MPRAGTALIVLVMMVVAMIVAYGAWRVARALEPATVCITHPAHVVRCVPIGSRRARHEHVRAMCRAARDRVDFFCSYTDLWAAHQIAALADGLPRGVRAAVYYEPRPVDPRRAEIHEVMRGLRGNMHGHALRRRTVAVARWPFLQVASTHVKLVSVDSTRFTYGSGNALLETHYYQENACATCQQAESSFLAPSFLDVDVALDMSSPVEQIPEYLRLVAQQRPWAERSLHITFRDGNEFHVFPAAVLSREGFLATLVDGAHTRVLVGALSVWPTGGFRAALVAAAQRGCAVTLVGSACACSKSQRLLARLNRCAAASYRGWRYREWTPREGLVHAKFLLVDDDVVLPSFNYSFKSTSAAADDEAVLVLKRAAAAATRDLLDRMVRERTVPVTPEPDLLGDALLAMLNPLL